MIKQMVDSSEIQWIGYEHRNQMLQVDFLIGSVYQFDHVPESVYQAFLIAPSHTDFFEDRIKGHYPYRRAR